MHKARVDTCCSFVQYSAMQYQQLRSIEFFREVDTEEKARQWLWQCRFDGKDFVCPDCEGEGFWQHRKQAEIRECELCQREVRLRAATVFGNSKVPILTWLRAIFLVMQDKRGVSALQLMRQLGLRSYRTAWRMLLRIRHALRQRDDRYILAGPVIELDGASFGRRETRNQSEVLVAIETKDWVNDRGKPKSRAGFAKVLVTEETKKNAQQFVTKAIKPGALVNTDGSQSLRNLAGIDSDYQVTDGDPTIIGRWLPWVHRFISNAKTWILGTHHGIDKKYLPAYIAEYTYRFNRRHDPNTLFHRALFACAQASHVNLPVLCA